MNNLDALFNIGYGLYVITSNNGINHNGLIVNSVMQVTNVPNRIAVTIDKKNYSHDTIKKSGIMNVNCLSTDAPFSIFENFGFKSGRDNNKFSEITPKFSENGLAYLPQYINAFISLKVNVLQIYNNGKVQNRFLDWQHMEHVHQMVIDGLILLDGSVERYVYNLVVADTNHDVALPIE